jgi:hypothetical protein
MDYQDAVAVFFAAPPADIPAPAPLEGASPARRLRDALEPVAMHAVWSPHTNAELAAHGFNFFTAYVTGRGSSLGDVGSAVVAATFGVFEPGLIDAIWTEGRSKLGLAELVALRDAATSASLRDALAGADEAQVLDVAETLENAVAGLDGTARPLFSAVRAQPRLDDPFGRLWRAADVVREHRGDGHLAASIAAGLDPVRMGVLMEVWLGYPVGEYSGTRAWPAEVQAAGVAALEADGLLADGVITGAGRATRDAIEDATDRTQDALVAALGADLDRIVPLLDGWSRSCIDAKAFPPDARKRAAG